MPDNILPSNDQIPMPLPRIVRFERLGYGLFLHWGLYSQLGRGEWLRHHLNIAPDEYSRLAGTFTARDFDAWRIVEAARESGMRYICLTTRHHDGFSLYDTRGLSEFDAPHSPAGRDLIAEFVEACRAQDIVPFLYHTTLDWVWDSARCEEAKFEEYLDYLNASVEVLCRHYGEVGGFWFDGHWSRPQSDWKDDRLYATIRRYQPEAIIINNGGLGGRGARAHQEIDSMTFEQGLPTAPDRTGWPKYVAGEMCETLNSHWGIAHADFNYKSTGQIIENFCSCRKVGANYLVNIGLTATGAIPAYEETFIRKVGQWIKLHGDLLYYGLPTDVRCQERDFVLKNGKSYYYFAHNLSGRGDANVVVGGRGNGPRSITGLSKRIKSVRWTDDGKIGQFVQSQDNSLLTLDCAGHDYGYQHVVRVAELSPD